MNFTNIVAEAPYDQMGEEFAQTFGGFLNSANLSHMNAGFNELALRIFKWRLDLATKFNTFFAKQVTDGGELWKDRFTGKFNTPCYSFAIPQMARTAKFFGVCEKYAKKNPANSVREWSRSYASLPVIPFVSEGDMLKRMPVWERKYVPQFEARDGGPFFFRWMQFSERCFLFEHPRSRWVHMLKNEAKTWWERARNKNLPDDERYHALASFEWVWTISNPFMRAGALTCDCLTLLVQKEMMNQGLDIHIRPYFYAQDCEALILPYEEYVAKRINDLKRGHIKMFDF